MSFADHFKSSSNRNPLKQFFITYPKSGELTKEQFLISLQTFMPIETAVIVSELHKDGSPHLHALVVLAKAVALSKVKVLDYLAKLYPNDNKRIDVRGMRSWSQAFGYVTKPEKTKYVDPSPLLLNCSLDAPPKPLSTRAFITLWADRVEASLDKAEVRRIQYERGFNHYDQNGIRYLNESEIDISDRRFLNCVMTL